MGVVYAPLSSTKDPHKTHELTYNTIYCGGWRWRRRRCFLPPTCVYNAMHWSYMCIRRSPTGKRMFINIYFIDEKVTAATHVFSVLHTAGVAKGHQKYTNTAHTHYCMHTLAVRWAPWLFSFSHIIRYVPYIRRKITQNVLNCNF